MTEATEFSKQHKISNRAPKRPNNLRPDHNRIAKLFNMSKRAFLQNHAKHKIYHNMELTNSDIVDKY